MVKWAPVLISFQFENLAGTLLVGVMMEGFRVNTKTSQLINSNGSFKNEEKRKAVLGDTLNKAQRLRVLVAVEKQNKYKEQNKYEIHDDIQNHVSISQTCQYNGDK